jgi:hypothetical protein
LVYFFNPFVHSVIIWNIFSRFGQLCGEKSGNLGVNLTPDTPWMILTFYNLNEASWPRPNQTLRSTKVWLIFDIVQWRPSSPEDGLALTSYMSTYFGFESLVCTRVARFFMVPTIYQSGEKYIKRLQNYQMHIRYTQW